MTAPICSPPQANLPPTAQSPRSTQPPVTAHSPPITPTTFALANLAQRKARRRRRAASRAGLPRIHSSDLRLSPTQRAGLEAEQRAVEWLQTRGLVLLACNLRCPFGELDAVFRADERTLVIVEIRHRRRQTHGTAAASITPAKQQRIRLATAWYLPSLARLGFAGTIPHCRFDAVCIDGDTMQWLQAVF